MNKRLLSLAVAGAMVLGLAGLANAGVPDDATSSASSGSGAIMIAPGGTGPSLGSEGLTVNVTVLDVTSAPVSGYPWQDIYLDDDSNGHITLCNGGSTADGDTDALGETTISGAIAGGGQTQSGMRVFLAGTPITGLLSIDIVSPDIKGVGPGAPADLNVDAIDVGEFAIDYAGGVYVFRSDMIPDGTLNVADVGEFAIHLGEVCP